MRQRYTVVQWRNWLAEFEQSNLTVVEFCESVGTSVASFYKWRHRLKSPRRNATEPIGRIATGQQGIKVLSQRRRRQLPGNFASLPGNFVPLVVRTDELEIRLPGGAQVRVSNDTDSLRPVLELLFELGARQ